MYGPGALTPGAVYPHPLPGLPTTLPRSGPRSGEVLLGYEVVPGEAGCCKCDTLSPLGFFSVILLALFCTPCACIPCCVKECHTPSQRPVYGPPGTLPGAPPPASYSDPYQQGPYPQPYQPHQQFGGPQAPQHYPQPDPGNHYPQGIPAAVPSNTCYTAPPVHPAMGVQLQPIAPVSQDVAAMGLPGSRQELVLQSHVDPSSNCKQVTTAEK